MTSIDPAYVIRKLGQPSVPSPLELAAGPFQAGYVSDDQFFIHHVELELNEHSEATPAGLLEKAGPRAQIYFDPAKVHAAILTAGGLCPGLNDVVRAAVLTLSRSYGVTRISGLRYGYKGLYDMTHYPPLSLDPALVRDISRRGGTMLGSSRGGGERSEEMADAIASAGINLLLTIGGDGTQKGALRLCAELDGRGLPVAIVGIPKTIDNDLSFVERSFGFQTAVSQAVQAVLAAHIEARDAVRGIGLVRVMGRESGFIAAHTALAHAHVDFVLIPEVPFQLEGPHGFLAQLDARVATQGHAVVLVAEGAGQELVSAEGHDASGNALLGDIGLFLKGAIKRHFRCQGRRDRAEVRRPWLHHPRRPRGAQRRHLLCAPGRQCGSRSHGGANRLHRRACKQSLRSRAHVAGGG